MCIWLGYALGWTSTVSFAEVYTTTKWLVLEGSKVERGPLIGILVPRRKSRIHVLDLYRSPPELNMQVCAFTPKGILWSRKQIIGVCQTKRGWKEKKLPFPDAVYNRIYTLRMKYAQAVGRVIGRKFFNAVTFFNKGIIFNALRESGVKSYLPATFIYDEAEVEGLLEEYKLLYVKPVYGVVCDIVCKMAF